MDNKTLEEPVEIQPLQTGNRYKNLFGSLGWEVSLLMRVMPKRPVLKLFKSAHLSREQVNFSLNREMIRFTFVRSYLIP